MRRTLTPVFDQIRKNLKQGNKATVFRNMQILDVRRDNPQELPGLRQQFDNHFLIDYFVGEKLHGVNPVHKFR